MKEYLFLIVLFFCVNLVAQQGEVERNEEKKSKTRSNSNVAPVYNNQVEPQMDESPSGKKLNKVQVQSAVLIDASRQLDQTLKEIKQMSSQKNPTSKQVQKLNYELIKIKNVNENAFEYHFYNYKIGNYDFDRIEDLKTAANLKPNHPEVLKSLSAYHYILNNEQELKQQLSKMYAAKHFSSELSSFASDVLKSLPKNSILITHGDDDTYPLLIEQYINSTRKDIHIISLDHLQSETYRNQLKNKGFKMPQSNIINTSFFKDFVALNKSNLIIATSIPKSYLETVKDQIQVEGLGFSVGLSENSKRDARLTQVFEKTIRPSLQNKKESSSGVILSNYLPFLFELRNYWIENGNLEKVTEVEVEIIDIGKQTNKLEQILKMLK